MISNPKWLPPKIDTNGVWEIVLIKLYNVFDNDFIIKKCHFDTYKIIFDDRKIDSPYEEGFWHLISQVNHTTNQREPDFPRAQKLPWCKPVIENHNDDLIKCWDYEEADKRIRTYIWLEDSDYIVIIENKKAIAFLVSAFHVYDEFSRLKLTRKYSKRVQNCT